ncbi:unnamed protein product [Cyclocybe aegerita]|uniref:Uncharacterized protein n=1 Tax=Cyclocybe aegerita TaxID=1973307 RepID=A0A8S0VV11_CYCAE|nr:unnamed protein product [Cyclocybe aegerita]
MPEDNEPVPLIIKSHSLESFCVSAKRLLEAKDYHSFVRFVLSGVHGGHQAFVDPILNRLSLDPEHEITGLRDYDSLLGVDDEIQVDDSITIQVLGRVEDTLRKNVHINLEVYDEETGPQDVPVHKIPNLAIGKWDTHNLIRVVFPALYGGDRLGSHLSQLEQTIFYEKGLRPAVVALIGNRAADWPPTYADEMFRARGHNGQLSLGTRVLPRWEVPSLGSAIRRALKDNGVLWGEGMKILHQIRGVKNSSTHGMNLPAAAYALDDWLRLNHLRPAIMNMESSSWFIDVGIELTSELGECLLLRTDAHTSLVRKVLEINESHASRITKMGSTKYTRDTTSHLSALSGCRITPGVRAQGRFEAVYLQMYQTDKMLTSRPDQGHFGKFLTAKDALAGKYAPFMDNLYHLYSRAMVDNSSKVRIEVRVPLKFATEVLLNLSISDFQASFVSFGLVTWWSLRAYRVTALKFLLEWQDDGEAELRATHPALLLTAAVPWILNGLHSAPDDGPSSREIMDAVLPLSNREGLDPNILAYNTRTSMPTFREDSEDEGEVLELMDVDEEDEEDVQEVEERGRLRQRRRGAPLSELTPCIPYGLLFLRPLRVGGTTPVPRLCWSRVFISEHAFRFIFGADEETIIHAIRRSRIAASRNPNRTENRKKKTLSFVNHGQAPEGPIFHLEAEGYSLPPVPRDEGSDMELEEEDMAEPRVGLDDFLTNLWNQFLLDITEVSPNPKPADQPPYCILSPAKRKLVNAATYQDLCLSNYFTDVQWKYAEPSDWVFTFDHLFPPKNAKVKTGKIQNYLQTTYYSKWESMRARTDAETVKKMHKNLFLRFCQLSWFPAAQANRIWWTKVDRRSSKSSGLSPNSPAPRILLHPDVQVPTWQWD